jgi:hypothetical protein
MAPMSPSGHRLGGKEMEEVTHHSTIPTRYIHLSHYILTCQAPESWACGEGQASPLTRDGPPLCWRGLQVQDLPSRGGDDSPPLQLQTTVARAPA